ncbi:MAG: hypothetical protein E6Q97_13255 [Desulfurellales bacterium]|nr:MAG: hypothetical protein E6Q97_13255 [Desulfurellales bacterium]
MTPDQERRRLEALENVIAPRIWQVVRETLLSEQRRIWESMQALAEHSPQHGTVFRKDDLKKIIFNNHKEPA